jgi:hypothetical protein
MPIEVEIEGYRKISGKSKAKLERAFADFREQMENARDELWVPFADKHEIDDKTAAMAMSMACVHFAVGGSFYAMIPKDEYDDQDILETTNRLLDSMNQEVLRVRGPKPGDQISRWKKFKATIRRAFTRRRIRGKS